MKLSEIVARVIALASAVDEVDDAYFKTLPGYPCINAADLVKLPPRAVAERKELRDFLAGLSPATIYALVVLMDIGRRWFGTEDLLWCYEDVGHQYPKLAAAVRYLLSKDIVFNLIEGLRCLSEDKIDVDRVLG